MMRLNDMAQNYGANNIDSLESHICTASVVYHFCSENRLFKILPQKPAQIANLKNPDLDVIRRIHPECRFYGLTIRWIFPPKRTHIFIKKSYNVKRRRQQGRKKSSGHISKTTIFARASRFFFTFFCRCCTTWNKGFCCLSSCSFFFSGCN